MDDKPNFRSSKAPSKRAGSASVRVKSSSEGFPEEVDGAGAPIGEYSVDNQIGFLLRLAHQRHNANLADRLSRYNVTPPQAVVLARLLECSRLSQNHLGRLVAMEPANIRDVVLRLKARGLIRQEKAPDDGRLLLLSLTTEGETIARKLIPLSVESVKETLRRLGADEAKTLRALLKKLISE